MKSFTDDLDGFYDGVLDDDWGFIDEIKTPIFETCDVEINKFSYDAIPDIFKSATGEFYIKLEIKKK